MRELVLTALEPISVGVSPQAGNSVDAQPYLPGSVVRGAVAAEWIRRHGTPQRAAADQRRHFVSLFEGTIAWGPLLAEGSAVEPMSVLRCKRRPLPDCGAVAIDLAAGESATACPSCGQQLQAGKGRVLGVTLVDRTRTALDDREQARDGSLFTRQALPAGTRLRGVVHGDDPFLDGLDGATVWFGGRKGVGGRARVAVRGLQTASLPTTRPDGRVVLRAIAPVILVDDATRPVVSFGDPSVLAEVAMRLGVDPAALELLDEWVRPVQVGGWHAASGLPKPREWALSAGSTAAFRCPSATADGLAALASGGLGLRRNEGFGMLEVNPPPWAPPPARQDAGTADDDRAVLALVDDIDEQLRRLPRAARPRAHRWILQTAKAWSARAGRPDVDAALRSRTAERVLNEQLRSCTRRLADLSTSQRADVSVLLDAGGPS